MSTHLSLHFCLNEVLFSKHPIIRGLATTGLYALFTERNEDSLKKGAIFTTITLVLKWALHHTVKNYLNHPPLARFNFFIYPVVSLLPWMLSGLIMRNIYKSTRNPLFNLNAKAGALVALTEFLKPNCYITYHTHL